MTLTLDISPELKEKLEAEAAKRRQTPEEYAQALVENSLPTTVRSGRAWSEIEGASTYPMVGEDAQAWVTRTRREGDEYREHMLNRGGASDASQDNP